MHIIAEGLLVKPHVNILREEGSTALYTDTDFRDYPILTNIVL